MPRGRLLNVLEWEGKRTPSPGVLDSPCHLPSDLQSFRPKAWPFSRVKAAGFFFFFFVVEDNIQIWVWVKKQIAKNWTAGLSPMGKPFSDRASHFGLRSPPIKPDDSVGDEPLPALEALAGFQLFFTGAAHRTAQKMCPANQITLKTGKHAR